MATVIFRAQRLPGDAARRLRWEDREGPLAQATVVPKNRLLEAPNLGAMSGDEHLRFLYHPTRRHKQPYYPRERRFMQDMFRSLTAHPSRPNHIHLCNQQLDRCSHRRREVHSLLLRSCHSHSHSTYRVLVHCKLCRPRRKLGHGTRTHRIGGHWDLLDPRATPAELSSIRIFSRKGGCYT